MVSRGLIVISGNSLHICNNLDLVPAFGPTFPGQLPSGWILPCFAFDAANFTS